MVFAVESSDFTIDDVLAMGGKAPATLARERQITRLFEDFVQEHSDSLSIKDLLAKVGIFYLSSCMILQFPYFEYRKLRNWSPF